LSTSSWTSGNFGTHFDARHRSVLFPCRSRFEGDDIRLTDSYNRTNIFHVHVGLSYYLSASLMALTAICGQLLRGKGRSHSYEDPERRRKCSPI
jgi:hypothetical protein